ncbi:MAG: hypothetical protein LBT12_06220 [Oscillospiraceae bacterium]|nr:hypothetical protein [Oscillospiraceae bacterium]
MKKRTNRALAYLLTLTMALALLPAITPPASAADFAINVSGTGSDTGYALTSAALTFNSAANGHSYTLTGTAAKQIIVPNGITIDLTLNGLTITSPGAGKSAMSLGGSAVKLHLAGTNALTGNIGGIQITGTSAASQTALTIDGGGSLVVACGVDGNGGAGIGASCGVNGYGDITIRGGATVTAIGGTYGAGIGGGGNSNRSGIFIGNVTIEGGATVTATCGSWGAGIGSGNSTGNDNSRFVGNVTIRGGAVVTATGGVVRGAGIGVGCNAFNGNVFIEDSCVVAVSRNNTTDRNGVYGSGAGIGSGYSKPFTGNVTIGSGAVVVAVGGYGAGIGAGIGGTSPFNGNIIINGGAVIAKRGAGTLSEDIGKGAVAGNSFTGSVIINGGSVYAVNNRINPAPKNGAAYGSQALSAVPVLVTGKDAQPVGGADVSAAVNQAAADTTTYTYSAVTSGKAALPAAFVTAANTALGGGFLEGIEGRAWLWLPTTSADNSNQTYDLKGHQERYADKTNSSVPAPPSSLEIIALSNAALTAAPSIYARVRETDGAQAPFVMNLRAANSLGDDEADREIEDLYWFREPVNGNVSDYTNKTAFMDAYNDAFTDNTANAATVAAAWTKDIVASDSFTTVYTASVDIDQNARYWFGAELKNTDTSETSFKIAYFDVKNIFTAYRIWMYGQDETVTADSGPAKPIVQYVDIPLENTADLPPGIPFDLDKRPSKDPTNAADPGIGAPGDVVTLTADDLTGLGQLEYDRVALYPPARLDNLYAWDFKIGDETEYPGEVWSSVGQDPKYPTVTLNPDFLDVDENTYWEVDPRAPSTLFNPHA